MKTKKIIMIIVSVIIAAFVLGSTGIVSLVNTAADEVGSADRLIGVFITRDYLDLFDSEQFFNDNLNLLVSGGQISESENEKYQGRLYATLVETRDTDEETGEVIGREEFVFEEVDGICFFVPQITDQFGTYWSSSFDEPIADGFIHFDSTDEGESISMEGTVYVSTNANAVAFYFNPVYQTSAGEVYVISGEGMFFGDHSAAGTSMSYEIKDTHALAMGDLTTSYGAEIKVTVCYMDEPEKVSILEFDEKNHLLAHTECNPNQLPDAIKVQPDTQYIIVETAISGEQGEGISRELFDREDETLSAFYRREDGICLKKECAIEWEK